MNCLQPLGRRRVRRAGPGAEPGRGGAGRAPGPEGRPAERARQRLPPWGLREPRVSSLPPCLPPLPAPLREGVRSGRGWAGTEPVQSPVPRRAPGGIAEPCQRSREEGGESGLRCQGCSVRAVVSGPGLRCQGCSEPVPGSPRLTRISPVTKPAAVRCLCPQRASPRSGSVCCNLSETQPAFKSRSHFFHWERFSSIIQCPASL